MKENEKKSQIINQNLKNNVRPEVVVILLNQLEVQKVYLAGGTKLGPISSPPGSTVQVNIQQSILQCQNNIS